MADPISALSALATVAIVTDLSCDAILFCLKAIKSWKTRHKFWNNVKNRFAEYLRVSASLTMTELFLIRFSFSIVLQKLWKRPKS